MFEIPSIQFTEMFEIPSIQFTEMFEIPSNLIYWDVWDSK